MNQQRYIVFAILIIVVGVAIYFVLKGIPADKEANNTVTIIDYAGESLAKVQPDGRKYFQSKCASCHSVFKDLTGPALGGITERTQWSDSKKLYSYIKHPELFDKNRYIDSLRQVYGSKHMGFPDLTDEEISAIFKYINGPNNKLVVNVVD